MKKTVFVIGRNPNCNGNEIPIIINESTAISRNHCKIFIENGNLYIIDLNSTNGTYVNGKSISGMTKIHPSSTIRFGQKYLFNINNTEIVKSLHLQDKKKTEKRKVELVKTKPKREETSHFNSNILSENVQYASFGNRLIGLLIDSFILGILSIPVYLIYFFIALFSLNFYFITIGFVFIIAAVLVITHFYIVIPISKKGYTFGRKYVGIKYLDVKTMSYPSEIRIWIRLLCYSISGLILMIGFLMALEDENKQALHDKIAGTIVIQTEMENN